MYRISLACSGVPRSSGLQAAIDIADEFKDRAWYTNVQCTWDGNQLFLGADSDVDSDGRGLADEFSDCIAACITELFDGEIAVISVQRLEQ